MSDFQDWLKTCSLDQLDYLERALSFRLERMTEEDYEYDLAYETHSMIVDAFNAMKSNDRLFKLKFKKVVNK